jgi:hypothetical protein
MKKSLLAAGAAAVIAIPLLAWSQDSGEPPPGPGQHGPMMMGHMMRHMGMMRGSPAEHCQERLARRAGHFAYVGARLNLTDGQRPLWDKLQSVAQSEEQKEQQLCAGLKPRETQTLLDRLDWRQQMLSARLEALQAAKAPLQALYQALTPEQRAILDHPFHRP